MKRYLYIPVLSLIILALVAGCNLPAVEAGPAQQPTSPTVKSTSTQPLPVVYTLTPTATLPPIASAISVTPTPSPTLDPYASWTIESLRARTYGGGNFEVVETLENNGSFTRSLIRYESDGLDIYGFMNVPLIDGPLPVVIAIHGYIEPEVYSTLDYTTRYADDLARYGYLVIHPNLRNYPPSSEGENMFRVGMAVDVLNLIHIIREQGGKPGMLEKADPERIGLWGHSMGGGISTRVMTVDPDIRAVVLYAAMSGEERKNFTAIQEWSDGERGLEELSVPEEVLTRISPEGFLEFVEAAVSIHHGQADELVPVEWSELTCDLLQELGKTVECTFYPGFPHTFWGEGDRQFMLNVVSFFERYLKNSSP
jgi:dipeptidyl aminopeptidase/acylaminoacyl peptidase